MKPHFYQALYKDVFCDDTAEVLVVANTNEELKKDTIVIIPLFDNIVTASIKKQVSALDAFSHSENPITIISIVDCSKYLKKIEDKKKENSLISKMQEQASRQTMIEKFQKVAGKDPVMQALFEEFTKLQTDEQTTEVNEEESSDFF